MSEERTGLTPSQARAKRCFDFCLASIGLLLSGWLILLAWAIASLETQSNGFFIQTRIGLKGKPFKVFKIKTMKPSQPFSSTVTCSNDPRITKSGLLFRKTKIDELPQLFNVFLGQMSFVGPRPDVPGYADKLVGDDRRMLDIRPGITGPATLAYRNEEEILAEVLDPIQYNNDVIYPHKVRLNIQYIESYSFRKDINYIVETLFRREFNGQDV